MMAQWNSKEGVLIISAFVAVTVFVTLFLQKQINKAIERRALSLSSIVEGKSSMISALGNMVSKKTDIIQPTSTEKSVKGPPEGSGRRYTPL